MPVRGDLRGVLSQHPEERVIEGSGPLVADADTAAAQAFSAA